MEADKNLKVDNDNPKSTASTPQNVKSKPKMLSGSPDSEDDEEVIIRLNEEDGNNIDNYRETDHLDQMQGQIKPNKQPKNLNTNKLSTPTSEEEAVPRSVSVVEHEHGFKSQFLNLKSNEPSSASSNRQMEQLISSHKNISIKDHVFDYDPSKNKLSDSIQSKSKNSVKFKEFDGDEEGSIAEESEPVPEPNNPMANKKTTPGSSKKASIKKGSILK